MSVRDPLRSTEGKRSESPFGTKPRGLFHGALCLVPVWWLASVWVDYVSSER